MDAWMDEWMGSWDKSWWQCPAAVIALQSGDGIPRDEGGESSRWKEAGLWQRSQARRKPVEIQNARMINMLIIY